MALELDEIRTVTAFAALAPSVHNTQPWQMVARGHTIEVRADHDRQLGYLDPSARQLHISCGITIEFARLGVRALGHDCVVRLAPDAGDPDFLATLTAGHRMPLSPAERRLVDAIPRRYTDRGCYEERPVPSEVLERARAVAVDRGCWLRVLDRPGDRVTVATLLAEAEAVEAADARYADELAAWRREEAAEDGIPRTAFGEWGADVVSDVPLRDFDGRGHHRAPDSGEAPQVERDTLLLLGSDDDSVGGWLRTGRALALVWLTLTAADLVAQPLGPVTDVPTTRRRLQLELGLLGWPQIMLRTGYGKGAPRAGRRDLEGLLTVASVA